MDIVNRIGTRLNDLDLDENYDKIMRIVCEETAALRPNVKDEVNFIVDTLDPDKINVVYVYTGMMPKVKAEEHIKKVAAIFDNVKPKSTQMMFLAYNDRDKCSVIHKLDKESAYIIQLNTGSIPKTRINSYLEEQRANFGTLFASKGYDIEIIGVSEVDKLKIYKKY